MERRAVYQFADSYHHALLSEVGGKGLSLIKMAQSGLAIPPGFVLSVAFFQPWIDELKTTPAWNEFLTADSRDMPEKIKSLKAAAMELNLTQKQQTLIICALAHHPGVHLFAVRSSAPEEDLSDASFAGGYETVLGVTQDAMENAIKTAFASCLDPRVFIYKREQGFATNDFSIAVVVMEQIASEVAGVGFSVNPLSNDHDEMVFNANWGQGETVVAGLVTPDQYIVNKISGDIMEKTLGGKETSIWLLPDGGGTEERADPRHDEFTLSDEQILELSRQLSIIEKLYGRAMDIEWAYARGQLYLLQARPITTCIPLPRGMMTEFDEPRQLYLDLTLSVQGLEKPLSPLGTDFIRKLLHAAAKTVIGRNDILDIRHGAAGISDGKIYLNLSNIFTVISKDKIANALVKMDAIASNILLQLPQGSYQNAVKPEILNINKFDVATRMYDVVLKIVTGKYRLAAMAHKYDKDVAHMEQVTDSILAENTPLSERIEQIFKPFAYFLVHKIAPAAILGQRAIASINKLFEADAQQDKTVKAHLDAVSRSLPHNITIQMGLDIYSLSTLLEKDKYHSQEELVTAFRNKQLSPQFYQDWDKFIDRFGCRGQEEFDIASPRYMENDHQLLSMIYSASTGCNDANNPLHIYQTSQDERQKAYEYLLTIAARKGKYTIKKFKTDYAVMEQFGGYRENHKYFLVRLFSKIRQLLLTEAKKMVLAGVLEHEEQIFDLTLVDLSAYESDPEINLVPRMAHNTEIIKQLETVKTTPPLIDSRGRILRLNRPPLKEGEIGGHAVSSGKISGKVKVLHTPDEKPLLMGEILVARATDPGWTPLFVNAGAIILEIGGMLQHGALVAREYGKPCIAGVDNATEILKDGDLIEVDGSLGIIRRIDTPDSMENISH
ncbi:PEP/pyruvate-binding domain-containing protein [Legionella dresdenensis]|uniref:PEP/pyruvate-binding domain-containing protein n=1 Tax=Legionella dresdenensis TaxID=450200 RepID=A0ABV8CGI0_9GAMM